MWQLADQQIDSRFLLGTASYPSPQIMCDAIKAAETQVITVSLARQNPQQRQGEQFWQMLKTLNCHILPNTAGCRSAKEAITMALMARDIFATNWIKLEVIGDDYTLQPDPFELIIAAEELHKQNFIVFPYCTDDLIVCKRLVDAGCQILMPWAAPIGSGQGIINPSALMTLRQRFPDITLIIDAGIGSPADATAAMELGFDGILLNSAVARAANPVLMASAFKDAISAGRKAFQAGIIPEQNIAQASTALIDTPFWYAK